MLPPETLVKGVMRVELTGGKVSALRAGKRGNHPVRLLPDGNVVFLPTRKSAKRKKCRSMAGDAGLGRKEHLVGLYSLQ